MSQNIQDYEIPLIFCLAHIIADETTDKIIGLRYQALEEVRSQLAYYKSLGYTNKLLYPIAEKKCDMVLNVKSKADIERLKPKPPHYDGNKFIPGENSIPEEELIAWSQTSLKGPLNSIGFKRYMELFKEVYPEESAELDLKL